MALPTKFIVFLGRTLSGHNHDYLMLKQEFPPELDWFTDINGFRAHFGDVGKGPVYSVHFYKGDTYCQP